MIEFQRLNPGDISRYLRYFQNAPERGCEYSFANLMMWGRQRVFLGEEFVLFFSQFDRLSVYPFPVGQGEIRPVLETIMQDARRRGIPCRLTSMTKAECEILEQLYPGKFQFHTDRDGYDYVYPIEALATLKGKRYQSKRNFANRFHSAHPDCETVVLHAGNLHLAQTLAEEWYRVRLEQDPLTDYHLEQVALRRAFSNWDGLGLEGLVLAEQGKPLAMTVGSRLSGDTFDIHFEKAISFHDGAYAAVNQTFAGYLREKHPQLRWLNREDDMGIEGLRKAKLSYHPDRLVEKYWARLWEEDDEA